MNTTAYTMKSPYNNTVRIHTLNPNAPDTYPTYPVVVVSVNKVEKEGELPYVMYKGEKYHYKNGFYYPDNYSVK